MLKLLISVSQFSLEKIMLHDVAFPAPALNFEWIGGSLLMTFSRSYFSSYWSSWFQHSDLSLCSPTSVCLSHAYQGYCGKNRLLGQLPTWSCDTGQGVGTVDFTEADTVFIIHVFSPFILQKQQAFLGELPDNDILPPRWPQDESQQVMGSCVGI